MIQQLFHAIAQDDVALGCLVIGLAVGCVPVGVWLYLDALRYVRQRRQQERRLWLRALSMEVDEARARAGLPRMPQMEP